MVPTSISHCQREGTLEEESCILPHRDLRLQALNTEGNGGFYPSPIGSTALGSGQERPCPESCTLENPILVFLWLYLSPPGEEP